MKSNEHILDQRIAEAFKYTLGLEEIPRALPNIDAKAENSMSAGTVLIGLKCHDGAILLADQKASMGNWGLVRDEEKIIPINDRFAMSITGAASHGKLMGETLHDIIGYMEDRYKKPATMKAVIQLYRNISLSSGGLYLMSLMVGTDQHGAHLVEVSGFDGYFKNKPTVAAAGSGSPFAKAILEGLYTDGTTATAYSVVDDLLNRKQARREEDIFSIQQALVTQAAEDAATRLYERLKRPATPYTLPDDGLTQVLTAAIWSSHEDNANDPAIFTRPPYHVLIARPGKGLQIVAPDEITVRYELLMPKIMETRVKGKSTVEDILSAYKEVAQ